MHFCLFLPLQRIHKCGPQIIPFQFQRHFQFRAKYSNLEYRVVATTTHDDGPTQRLDVGNAIRRHKPTMVLAVFTLPDQLAAMTVPSLPPPSAGLSRQTPGQGPP